MSVFEVGKLWLHTDCRGGGVKITWRGEEFRIGLRLHVRARLQFDVQVLVGLFVSKGGGVGG